MNFVDWFLYRLDKICITGISWKCRKLWFGDLFYYAYTWKIVPDEEICRSIHWCRCTRAHWAVIKFRDDTPASEEFGFELAALKNIIHVTLTYVIVYLGQASNNAMNDRSWFQRIASNSREFVDVLEVKHLHLCDGCY